jgi:hypothetical protein
MNPDRHDSWVLSLVRINASLFPTLHQPMTDPFSLSVGTISLLSAGAQAVKAINELHSDYRDAGKQAIHARAQHVLLRENVLLAKSHNTSLQSRPKILASQLALERIEEEFPANFRSDRKRDRVRWALKDKSKLKDPVCRLKETEISTILALQLQIPYVHTETDFFISANLSDYCCKATSKRNTVNVRRKGSPRVGAL